VHDKDKKMTLSKTNANIAIVAAAQSATTKPAGGESTAPAVTSAAGYRVLVADDNPINRQLAQRLLEKLGCLVDLASDGHEAVAMHQTRAYDLLLMDCQMPRLDGYQATARIRAMEGEQRTTIIALTAYSTQGEQDKCRAAGMDDLISKPIGPQALEQKLGRWLQPDQSAPAVAAMADDDEMERVQAIFGADFAELALLYEADSPRRIAVLRQAGAMGDAAQIAKVAHAFRGSCASMGAMRLAALCKALELHAKSGALRDFEQKVNAIEAEYSRVSAKLQSLMRAAR
jgi:CheY-like chemotaxis protein/HPt (histidine-containing phosphotransfer) domain-containing protein